MTKQNTLKPEISKAINAFGQNNYDEAEKYCNAVLTKGDDPDANHIIGCIRMREKKYEESITFINKALLVKENDIGILISLGCAQSSKKDYLDSINTFTKVVKLKDDISQVHFYLGESYRQTDQFNKAVESFKRCLEITPDHIGCQLILGITYEELKKFDQAISFYKSCIDTFPDYIEPHVNLAMCYLLTGNYTEGWREFEWRLKMPVEFYKRDFGKTYWNGQDVDGKNLMIIAEHSVGETFQYLRFAKQLALEGASVTIMAQDPIINFLKTQEWIVKVIPYDGEVPEIDYYCYMISLAKILEWEPNINSQKFPYVTIEKKTSPFSKNKKKVGLVTTAPKELSNYKQIVLPDNSFDYLLSNKNFEVIDLTAIDDLDDLISTIDDCDFVITIEGIVPHIAGALNKETWVMLPAVPKHTWDLNYKKSSPWYPSLELFRQETIGDWSTVLNEIKQRLDNV